MARETGSPILPAYFTLDPALNNDLRHCYLPNQARYYRATGKADSTHRIPPIRRHRRIGTLSFGLSFGLALKNNRSANAIRKKKARHSAAFAMLSLNVKTWWDFSGVICVNPV
jgi:hypothetical protein